jgi:hypothetical protein
LLFEKHLVSEHFLGVILVSAWAEKRGVSGGVLMPLYD